jgi:hypothetical protein
MTERPPRRWPKIVLVSLALACLGAAIVRYSLHEEDPPPRPFVPTTPIPKAKTKAKSKAKEKGEVPPKLQPQAKR